MHFIDGILNAQRYRDEILRPIVVPFMLSNQHLDMPPAPVRWMDYLGKGEVFTNTDLDRFVNNS